jgi:hypothetical protein
MASFRLPDGKHELVKQNAYKIMGNTFQRWRWDLNKRFIQKGLTPFHEFGNITHNQWAKLMAEKTSPKALTLSKRNSEQAKKNKHYPRLGPGGYHAKQEVFRKMDEVAEASRDLKKQKVKNLKPRLKQWIYARSMDSSDLAFAEPETE